MWKRINDYEDYEINDSGEVRSTRFDRLLKPTKNNSGYLYVNITKNKIKKTTAIHKLVMQHFGTQKPEGNYIIDHIDGDKCNNHINNLQWKTIKENTEKYYNNFDKKTKIIDMYTSGFTPKQIKNNLEVNLGFIYTTIYVYQNENINTTNTLRKYTRNASDRTI